MGSLCEDSDISVSGLELLSSLNILRSAFNDIHTSRKVTVWEYVHVMPEHHLCVYTAHMELGKGLVTRSNGDGQRATNLGFCGFSKSSILGETHLRKKRKTEFFP